MSTGDINNVGIHEVIMRASVTGSGPPPDPPLNSLLFSITLCILFARLFASDIPSHISVTKDYIK